MQWDEKTCLGYEESKKCGKSRNTGEEGSGKAEKRNQWRWTERVGLERRKDDRSEQKRKRLQEIWNGVDMKKNR